MGWDGPLREFFDVVRRLVPDKESFRLLQIKEKFAGLRIYYRLGNLSDEVRAEIADAYRIAMEKCERTCELSGEPGRLVNRSGYYCVRAERFIEKGDEIL